MAASRASGSTTVVGTVRRLYGDGPLHLVVLVLTLGTALYAVVTLLAGEQASWLRIGVWFVAAVFVNDLVLNPLAAVLDGVLRVGLHWLPATPAAPTTINHVRVPVLGAALTFLLFFPGIVRQGEPVVMGQSGLDGVLRFGLRWLPERPAAPTTVNHIRLPLLGAALTFLLFFPGIVRQGEPVVMGQSGLDQSPFLLRWVLLVVGMVAVSALVYVVRRRRATRAVTRPSAAGG